MNSQTKNYIIGALASFIINIALILLPLYILTNLRDYKIASTEHKTTLDIKNFKIDEEPVMPQKNEGASQRQEKAIAKQQPNQTPKESQRPQKSDEIISQKTAKTKTKPENTQTDANKTTKETQTASQAENKKTGSTLLSAINTEFKAKRESRSRNGLLKKYYGDELDKMSADEEDFLEKNFSKIVALGQIQYEKQIYMNNVRGTGDGVLEFYLLPNGDTEGMKITTTSYNTRLDKTAMEATELAKKDFPRPKVKTKIKFPFYIH